MKKLVIAAGVAGLVYYFFFYNRGTAVAAIPSTAATTNGAATLNNPVGVAGAGNSLTLGPSFAQRVPGVNSVS